MRIRPLQGQVLIFLLPRDEKIGEIYIPETANDGKVTHEDISIRRPSRKAVIKEIGPWKKVKSGHALLPEFKIGDTVVLNDYVGTSLDLDGTKNLRLVNFDDILGVLTSD